MGTGPDPWEAKSDKITLDRLRVKMTKKCICGSYYIVEDIIVVYALILSHAVFYVWMGLSHTSEQYFYLYIPPKVAD